MQKPLIWVVLLALGSIIAVEASANTGVDFSIRFFDRRIYYVEGDPIYIQVTVTNNSPSTYRFKLADDRAFSLEFDARTVSNRSLEPSDSLIRKRTQYQQVFFREIAVETGESFSFVEDLRSYVQLREPGSLVVMARMYPELIRPDSVPAAAASATAAVSVPREAILESKRLNLSIRPPVVTGPDGIPLEMDTATNALLVRERLAPDQVVEYTLTARQKSQWEKFYLYLDLDEMLARDPIRQRKWQAESEAGRRKMAEEYRRELRNSALSDQNGSISLIPSSFTIERTQYNSFEGSVIVLEKFNNVNYTELKRYTYYLRLKDNIWSIVDYSVVNLGTE